MFVSTRWGSWIPVIRSVLSIEDVIVRVAKTHKFAYPDQDEMDYLRNVLKILEPFEEIIISSQSTKRVTISSISKEEIPETSNAYILNDQLRVDLMCRFRYLLDPSVANFDSAFLVTTVSDVNTMDTLEPEEEQVGIDYLVKMSNGHLINLCISLLSVPATGSPVERVFSIAGMMVNKHRSRTEEELLDAKLIVYNNHITAFTN
uniref:HAT C-terminal dimerisation domain-containing protein n=1 Tax=Ditylenchus dipsaci TaxID=166011 RepID=A0A915EPT2_9BILA